MTDLKTLSIEALEELIKAARAEIDSRKKIGVARVEFGSYNDRRYSRPWIAVVSNWEVGGRPELEFGSWVGNARDGGIVEIKAKDGDIIRWGRKDNRGNGTMNKWGVFRNGEIEEITPETARELFKGE